MNDDDLLEENIRPLTAEQEQRKDDLVLELHQFDHPREAMNVVTFAIAEFLSQVAPDKDTAMGATIWMMACITMTLEQWDKQKLCNWNETRQ